jgi:hypothetical protein
LEAHADTPKLGATNEVQRSSPNLNHKRKLSMAPLVETDVRRSIRIKGKDSGFKGSSCPSKACLCCDTVHPTLFNRVIRSLGKDFYKIPASQLSEDNLKKKPQGSKACISKKGQNIKASKSQKKSNDESPKKKSRKE